MTPTILLFTTLLLAALAFTTHTLVLRHRIRAALARKHGCLPLPHVPHKDRLLGLDYYIAGLRAFRQSQYLARLRNELDTHGSTFQFNQFGSRNIVTRDPANFKAILATDFAAWGAQKERYVPIHPLAGDNFFSVDGALWRDSRDRIKPAIARNEYADYAPLEKYMRRFLDLVPRDGSTIDMLPLCGRLMQDYMSEYLSGRSIDSLLPHPQIDQQAVSGAVDVALRDASERFLVASWLGDLLAYVPLTKKVKNACNTIHTFIDNTIQAAFDAVDAEHGTRAKESQTPATEKSSTTSTSTSTSRYVFVNEVARNCRDKVFLRNLTICMYIGATDTTVSVIGQVIWALARDKRVLRRLRDEVLALGDAPLDLPTLQKMTYLQAVIKETIRLWPIVGFTVRYAVKDTILPRGGGPDGCAPTLIKAGTHAFLGFQALHYDTSIWGADAAEFRPERFLDTRVGAWEYLPFGGGGRVCPGQSLALASLPYVVVRLLQEFRDIECRDERPWVEDIKLFLRNANGVRVGFVPA